LAICTIPLIARAGDVSAIGSPFAARASFFRCQFRQRAFSGYQNNDGFRERHLHLAAVVGVALFQMEALALLDDLPVDLEWVFWMFQRRIQADTNTSQTRPIIKSKSQSVPNLVRDHKGWNLPTTVNALSIGNQYDRLPAQGVAHFAFFRDPSARFVSQRS
jgi:hypothetical protein